MVLSGNRLTMNKEIKVVKEAVISKKSSQVQSSGEYNSAQGIARLRNDKGWRHKSGGTRKLCRLRICLVFYDRKRE
jgi:hypothetical protein|tara:strand:+ start:5369 stop:5596 length:228 start_codon:yes stop_codon:yes gene_type:complete